MVIKTTPAQVRTTTAEQAQELVYSPTEVGNLVLRTIDERRKDPDAGIRMGIPSVDRTMLPLRPGELVTITGRPSNYKSGLMSFWARRCANDLIKREKDGRKIVVYVTWEMAVEEVGLYDLASGAGLSASELAQGRCSDIEVEHLRTSAMKRALSPIWLIGHSIERRKKRTRMTLSNVARALQWLDDEMDFHPAIVFLDYLQQITPERIMDNGETSRRMDIFENVARCKNMALALGCPVVLGVQAGRQVDDRDWKVPQMGDQQESSNIEHTADKMLGVWYPKTSEQVGDPLPTRNDITVTENLLILSVVKQRLGPAGGWIPLYVDPTRNEIGEMML